MYAIGIAKSQAQSQVGARRSRSAREAAPAEAIGEDAAAAAAARSRARRRKRATMGEHGRRYEHMDLEPDPVSDNGSGAGPLGQVGVLGQAAAKNVAPTGITTMAADPFNDDVTRPLLPNTWRHD